MTEYFTKKTNHLLFSEIIGEGKKTKVVIVMPLDSCDDVALGTIGFRPQWRRYVFYPNGDCLFDHECLEDIAAVLVELTEEWKKEQKLCQKL